MNTNECQGTNVPPCILFIKEKEYLTPLPARAVVDSYLDPRKVKVSPQQLVYFSGVQYSVDKKYINECVSLETFEDKLQIYYKGKLIQVHNISRNPINYTKKHYEQSVRKQLGKNKKFDDVVSNNLSIMDRLLEARAVSVAKDDAVRSYNHMIAYLVSQGTESRWIKRFIQTLNGEERNVLSSELSKVLPYVTDEKQFFHALRNAATRKDLKMLRVSLWALDVTGGYDFLSQEGYDSICSEFDKETTEYMKTIRKETED